MKKYLLLLALLFLVLANHAATSSSDLYAKLRSAYQSLKSFQAEVLQSNFYPQLNKAISYDGKIYFTPGRMLMSFTKPSVQRLKIEAGRVELYDASSNTLFRTDMLPEFGRMNPVEILQLYWTKSSVTVTSEDKNSAGVKLVPAKDDLVRTLSATLNKNSGIVSKLSYTDRGGNSVTYTFTNIKLNGSIPESVWNFRYPEDVQVVEQ
ncbi:MAG: outer membrane lipoprotein carrier protein LolA [Candidatus Syntrophosphaera sp.]|nr:outer membrane lipoprotein carrier protein LolA [Candidatus Syntrophosphaera sp.]